MPRGARSTLVALALIGPCARSLAAQERPDAGTLVYTLGRDTTAIESFVRRSRSIEGRVLDRIPFLRVRSYSMLLADDGTPRRIDYRQRLPDGELIPGEVSDVHVNFGPDSATIIRTWPDSGIVARIAAPRPTYPFVTAGWYGLYHPMLAEWRRSGQDSGTIRALPVILNLRTVSGRFEKSNGRINVTWPFFGVPLVLDVDPSGRILQTDGRLTTLKEVGTRRPPVDFDRLVAAFHAQERRHGPFSTRSTRDTVQATVGGAHLWIDYGRPARRGRAIFGQLVPYGEVWRTGADAATQFRTDQDLIIGDATIAAGTYTLWTIPTAQGGQLIVNRQTGQWGTQYDKKMDLVRIPLTRSEGGTPLERFTISIVARAQSSVLELGWDRARFRVPVQRP